MPIIKYMYVQYMHLIQIQALDVLQLTKQIEGATVPNL